MQEPQQLLLNKSHMQLKSIGIALSTWDRSYMETLD